MIINDDILNWCKEYKGEKFHALLCDPPYHLTMDKRWANDTNPTPAMKGKVFERQTKGFMGKSWDGGDIAFRKETWEALKEHLYPGAFCFAFASTRGLHRMMCAIEDAGFVIHPTIFLYAFGSGFPKATRIDTQIQCKEEQEKKGLKLHTRDGDVSHQNWTKIDYTKKDSITNSKGINYEYLPTDPIAKRWTGHRYGLQAIKPAVEPIICFQKRYEGKPVNCIVETGAGALNIDGGRISTNENINTHTRNSKSTHFSQINPCKAYQTEGQKIGRWPSNLIIDKECAERFPMTVNSTDRIRHNNQSKTSGKENGAPCYGKFNDKNTLGYSDSGTAARYFKNVEMKIDNADPVFYTSKVSKEERNKGCENKFVSTDIICYICNVDLINNTESNLLCDANIIQEAKKVKLSEVMEIFQKKDIEEFGTQAKSDIEWNTMLFMKNILELYQKDTKSTILTEINSTTISQIYNWLINYFTQESIRGVNCEMTAGGSLVLNVKECYMNQIITGTNKGILSDNAKSAELKLLVEITIEEMQSKHPTLKPIDLTTYLATLLLPPIEYAPRRILVPFAGAGSEMIGCLKAGWEDIVGIELTEEYIPIIEARFEYYKKQIELEKSMQLFEPEIMESMNKANKAEES